MFSTLTHLSLLARLLFGAFATVVYFLAVASAQAENSTPNVVVSIKPIELIARTVMKGVGEPTLLLETTVSPHTATLKPSQARLLEKADIAIRIGGGLESFLDKPFEALSPKARKLSLADAKGIRFPEGVADDNQHDDHGDGHGHKHKQGHGHWRDPHIWLDPQNALVMAGAIARELIAIDPVNASTYLANTSAFTKRIFDLERDLKKRFEPFAKTRFITLHDGYGHFYARFELSGGRAVSVSDQNRPGAATVRALQAYISKHSVRCAFVEPQNSQQIMDLITSAGAVRTEKIDPLGGRLSDATNGYEHLLTSMADTMLGCLRLR